MSKVVHVRVRYQEEIHALQPIFESGYMSDRCTHFCSNFVIFALPPRFQNPRFSREKRVFEKHPEPSVAFLNRRSEVRILPGALELRSFRIFWWIYRTFVPTKAAVGRYWLVAKMGCLALATSEVPRGSSLDGPLRALLLWGTETDD